MFFLLAWSPFPKDVACFFVVIVYVIQKPLMGPISVNYCYVNLSPM